MTSTDFTYTGQRDITGTGLMDYKARFYSPTLGRFTQPDTIIPNAADPQSWNRYSYVHNQPINYSDPSGHMRCDFCDGGGNLTQWQKNEDAKDLALLEKESHKQKCKAGNENYCPTVETHPAEVAGFVITGPVGGPLVENFVLGGGMTGLVDAAYLAAKPALMPLYVWISRFFTQNPESQTVSLGSFDPLKVNGYIEVANKAGNNFTYFSMNPTVYRFLNAIGQAKPINEGFMINQISQSKDFAVTIMSEAGAGTLMEMQMLAQSAYVRAGPLLESVTYFFSHPAIHP